MILYNCKNCNDLKCQTSICPVCGSRAELVKSKIYWSKRGNCPSFDQIDYETGDLNVLIGKDIRPVFAQERLLLEILLDKPFAFVNKSMWNVTSNRFVIDGKKITIQYKQLIHDNNADEIIEKMRFYERKNKQYEENDCNMPHIVNFIKYNQLRLNQVTAEAITYIKKVAMNVSLDEMFVSFSGGKDSTVTSDLVMRALNTRKIIHIYGDTTLEYPTSQTYLKRFRSYNLDIPVLTAKNVDQDFNNLCEVIGPPSRVMRWCCTVFKTGAITKKIESTFKDKKKIVSFQGIRRSESRSRSKYERESESPKITKQIAVSPVIDWIDFDIWLYILSNALDFNDAYRQGFSRVGCWCCPNNSDWSSFLSSIYMPSEYLRFKETLYGFAKKVGKEDWKEYIDAGKWKARQGGNGLEISKSAVVGYQPCVLEDNTYHYDLTRPIDDFLYTLFLPFGKLDFSMGNKRLNEVFLLDRHTSEPILKLTGRRNSTNLKITVLKSIPAVKNASLTETLLKCQITKFQTCLACGGCQSVCKHNALKVFNLKKGAVSNQTVSYRIDFDKCVGCLECVNHFESGCYMRKVLRIKNRG